MSNINIGDKSRRNFIKNTTIISIMFGLDPIKVLANNRIEINTEETIDINTIKNDFVNFSKQYSNYKVATTLSLGELQTQYNGLIKISSEASKPNFQSLTTEKKVKRIKELNAFSTGTQVTKDDSQKFYESVKQGRDAIMAAISLSTVAYEGAILLGHALSPAVYTLALPPIISVPMFIGAAGMATWSIYDLIGNEERNKKELAAGVIGAIENVHLNVYNKFLSTSNFDFEKELKGLQFNVSGKNIKPQNIFESIGANTTLSEKKLLAFIRSEIANANLFSSKEELAAFLDKYTEKIGDVQKQSIEEFIKAQKSFSQEEALMQRDKAALYQSINAFVGNAISTLAAPNEAKVINTLLNAGFQFVAGGGLTPYGWAAIGINIANALVFSPSGGSFEGTAIKMLAQIQKQLNVIIERIDILYQNQIEILKELRTVIDEVIRTQKLVNQGFNAVSAMQNTIYRTQLAIEQQNVQGDFQRYNRELEDELITNPRPNRNEVIHNLFLNIQSIALDKISLKPFTRFDNILMDSQYLKSEILFKANNVKYNIPLYNTIGLVPVLANYNPATNSGQSNIKIVHPVEFYTAAKSIISWLSGSKIDNSQKLTIVNNLLKGAEESRAQLNDAASFARIQEKANTHLRQGNEIVFSTRSSLTTNLKRDFLDKTDLRNKVQLKTQTNPDLEGFLDPSMQNHHHWNHFYNNRNDFALFNLAIDLGLITITTDSKKQIALSGLGGGLRDSVVGFKNNTVQFQNALIDFDTSIRTNIQLKYRRNLYAENVSYWSGQGVGGYQITSTYSSTKLDNGWKDSLRNEIQSKYQKNIDDILPEFKNFDEKEFINHLVGQHLRIKKKEYLNELKNSLLANNNKIDGTGLSLMVLSKLNQVITSDRKIPYEIDYFEEVFLKEDFESLFDFLALTDFNKKGLIIYSQIVNQYTSENAPDPDAKAKSIFYYLKENGEYSEKLNPELFCDFVAIMINRELKSTIEKCLSYTNEIKEKDGEPYISQSINELNGFKRLYLS